MKKLALFDIDGVIYNGHSIFDLIQDQEKRGVIVSGTWDKILIELQAYKTGQKNYTEAANEMLKVYAGSFKGVEYEFFVDDVFNFLNTHKNNFFPYVDNLFSKLKTTHDIFLITTNFQFNCEAIEKIFGLDTNHICSIAENINGKLTGNIKQSLAGNKGIVADLMNKYGKSGSIAVGDSENDADMLNLVELPLVMEPNDKLLEIAKNNNWQVVNRDTITDIITTHD